MVSCQLGHTLFLGGCREHGETCLTYLSLTAPRLIVQYGCTLLMYAAESKHSAALAKVLVEAKAEVNAANNVSAIECNRVGCHDGAQATSCSTVGILKNLPILHNGVREKERE